MPTPIRIGIAGYGNLGRGVESAVGQNPDMRLVGVFTRRDPGRVRTQHPDTSVFSQDSLAGRQHDIDALILCGGSKNDLPTQSPELAGRFNLVDSFDTHARIPEHFDAVDAAARAAGTTALISAGWDPGMFSIARVYGQALLPDGDTYTFWGRGLSQGHSEAIRRVNGVAAGVQYTVPSETAIAAVRSGTRPELRTREKHTRQCFVVLEEGADASAVREAIVSMPHYFSEYETTVTFITAEELARDHTAMPHGGFVIRSGTTGDDASQMIEYRLALGSNPSFTASVLVAYARAVHRMHALGETGALTVFDVPPGLLSPKPAAALRAEFL